MKYSSLIKRHMAELLNVSVTFLYPMNPADHPARIVSTMQSHYILKIYGGRFFWKKLLDEPRKSSSLSSFRSSLKKFLVNKNMANNF